MTVRIFRTENGEWTHASYSKKTAKLRHWSDGRSNLTLDLTCDTGREEFEQFQNSADVFRVNELVPYIRETRINLDKLKLCKSRKEWLEAFEHFKKLEVEGVEFSEASLSKRLTGECKSTDLIPQTSLRRFYETLGMLRGKKISKQIANHIVEKGKNRSDDLSEMIEQSIVHFSRYDNSDEAFRPKVSNTIDNYLTNRKQYAKCLQARMRANRSQDYELVVSDETNIGYVDFEISPWRKTNHAMTEDGRVGTSGGGGLDLLLVDQTDKVPVPIIGEVKAKTDRDLFLALIQSLMYTVEISSISQIKRLRKIYPDHFEKLPDDAKFDIYLLYQASSKDRLLYPQANALANDLFSYGGKLSDILRSIKFVQVDLGETDVKFKVEDIVSSKS